MSQPRPSRPFSLIEILFVMCIICVLYAIGAGAIRSLGNSHSVSADARMIISTIDSAQRKAVTTNTVQVVQILTGGIKDSFEFRPGYPESLYAICWTKKYTGSTWNFSAAKDGDAATQPIDNPQKGQSWPVATPGASINPANRYAWLTPGGRTLVWKEAGVADSGSTWRIGWDGTDWVKVPPPVPTSYIAYSSFDTVGFWSFDLDEGTDTSGRRYYEGGKAGLRLYPYNDASFSGIPAAVSTSYLPGKTSFGVEFFGKNSVGGTTNTLLVLKDGMDSALPNYSPLLNFNTGFCLEMYVKPNLTERNTFHNLAGGFLYSKSASLANYDDTSASLFSLCLKTTSSQGSGNINDLNPQLWFFLRKPGATNFAWTAPTTKVLDGKSNFSIAYTDCYRLKNLQWNHVRALWYNSMVLLYVNEDRVGPVMVGDYSETPLASPAQRPSFYVGGRPPRTIMNMVDTPDFATQMNLANPVRNFSGLIDELRLSVGSKPNRYYAGGSSGTSGGNMTHGGRSRFVTFRGNKAEKTVDEVNTIQTLICMPEGGISFVSSQDNDLDSWDSEFCVAIIDDTVDPFRFCDIGLNISGRPTGAGNCRSPTNFVYSKGFIYDARYGEFVNKTASGNREKYWFEAGLTGGNTTPTLTNKESRNKSAAFVCLPVRITTSGVAPVVPQ